MLDINTLRFEVQLNKMDNSQLVLSPLVAEDLLDRIEAAEKERDALRVELEKERKEHSYTQHAAEAKQVDRLRAKIKAIGAAAAPAAEPAAPTYSYSTDDEIYHGDFDSPDAAAAEAFYDDPELESVSIGENRKHTAHFYVSADRILEDVTERAYDECGEASEDWLDGVSVMNMPAMGDEREAWCAVGPAIRGWIDCWGRLAPDLRLYHMGVLADRLDADKPLTPRLVEQARAEFDATVARLADIPPGQVTSAIRTTEIAWEIEKLQRGEAA